MPTLTLTPSAVVNDPSYGTVPWTNPDGFRVKYNGVAVVELAPGEVSQYARASFDCSALPPGAVLTGIKTGWQVNKLLKQESGQPGDASVRIAVGGGVPSGDDKARLAGPGLTWPVGTTAVREYGGDGDLWAAGLDADAVRVGGLDAVFAARWLNNPSAGDVPDGAAGGKGDQATLTLYYQ